MTKLRRDGKMWCPLGAHTVPESKMKEQVSRTEWQILAGCKDCLNSTRIVNERAVQAARWGK